MVDVEMCVVLPLSMSNELTLYSRAMCSWCIDAKDFLQSRGYKFTEIDVGRNRAAYEEMKEISEQSYVPTLVAGEPARGRSFEETVRDYLNQELTNHDDARREAVLGLAEELMKEVQA